MSAEACDNWGPNGLGYYLAARFLWDVSEAERTDALIDDFLHGAFGRAMEPMRAFFKQLDGSSVRFASTTSSHTLNSALSFFREALGLPGHQLGQMFEALKDARLLVDDAAVRDRVDDFVLYARYADLLARYTVASGAERQAAFEALLRHGYRMRETMLVHTKALFLDLPGRDKTVTLPKEAGWKVGEPENSWKSSIPFSEAELSEFLQEGLKRYARASLDWVPPPVYSNDLASSRRIAEPDVESGGLGSASGVQAFLTRVTDVPASIQLGVVSSPAPTAVDILISRLGTDGDSAAGATQVRSDGGEHTATFPIPDPGLYRITVDDHGGRTLVEWKSDLPFVVKSSYDEPMSESYTDLWRLYFYVPRGTRNFAIYGGEQGEVHDSSGHTVFWLNGRAPDIYQVPVPDGEDGKFWRIEYGQGSIRLLMVPPYFAPLPSELLLPTEVISRDSG